MFNKVTVASVFGGKFKKIDESRVIIVQIRLLVDLVHLERIDSTLADQLRPAVLQEHSGFIKIEFGKELPVCTLAFSDGSDALTAEYESEEEKAKVVTMLKDVKLDKKLIIRAQKSPDGHEFFFLDLKFPLSRSEFNRTFLANFFGLASFCYITKRAQQQTEAFSGSAEQAVEAFTGSAEHGYELENVTLSYEGQSVTVSLGDFLNSREGVNRLLIIRGVVHAANSAASLGDVVNAGALQKYLEQFKEDKHRLAHLRKLLKSSEIMGKPIPSSDGMEISLEPRSIKLLRSDTGEVVEALAWDLLLDTIAIIAMAETAVSSAIDLVEKEDLEDEGAAENKAERISCSLGSGFNEIINK